MDTSYTSIVKLAIDLLSDAIREENDDLNDIPIEEVKRVIEKNIRTAVAELAKTQHP